jgi:putative endonuclease
LSNKSRTVLYIGVTNDLEKRVAQHKRGEGSFFTKKYSVNELVYYEVHTDFNVAIKREKQLKEWKRSYKDELIRSMNYGMVNLSHDWDG